MKTGKQRWQSTMEIGRGEYAYECRSNGGLALHSLGEVADILQISRAAVHQIERNALRKLRLLLMDELIEINPDLAVDVLKRERTYETR